METKICTRCGKEKELSEFGFSVRIKKDGSKGLRSACKSCTKECNKEYQLNNKDKIKEYKTGYYINNKDKINEKKKEYRLNNINKMKEYYENNKDKINEKKKEYRLNNINKMKEKEREYRLNKYNKLKSQELKLLNKEFESFIINNPKYYNKKAETWTYIIKSNGFYKIGITNRFIRRMKEINKHIPIYEVYRLPIDIERRLHLELEDYRFTHDEQFGGYTELFDITDEIASEIIKREHFKKVKKEFNMNCFGI